MRKEECTCVESYGDPPLLGFSKGQICVFEKSEDGFRVRGHGNAELVTSEEFNEHFKVLYPQHIRQRKAKRDAQSVGDFLEWLHGTNLGLARYSKDDRLVPVSASTEKILSWYFEIDLGELEDEKTHMLKRIRQRNKEAGYGS